MIDNNFDILTTSNVKLSFFKNQAKWKKIETYMSNLTI